MTSIAASSNTLWRKSAELMANTNARTSAASGSDDEPLFARVCSTGDHAAFAELVTRYRHRVIGLTMRMISGDGKLSRTDAEDLAQDAFVEAFHKRATFRKGNAFRPWLYRIAVNKCLDKLRSTKRYPAEELLPSDEVNHSPDPLSEVLLQEHAVELETAVACLPPKHRAVLVLRYIDDLSYEEIAHAAGLPVGTVKTYLFRARAELRRRLNDES